MKMWMLNGAACAFLCALRFLDDAPHDHAAAGETSPARLDEVRKAQEDLRRRMAWAVRKAEEISLDTPFESGLPACRSRQRRLVRTPMPRPLVGKSLVFAPADRMPRADLRVATRARRLAEVEADALADPALVERLGVRCWPTRIEVRSEAELELVENP